MWHFSSNLGVPFPLCSSRFTVSWILHLQCVRLRFHGFLRKRGEANFELSHVVKSVLLLSRLVGDWLNLEFWSGTLTTSDAKSPEKWSLEASAGVLSAVALLITADPAGREGLDPTWLDLASYGYHSTTPGGYIPRGTAQPVQSPILGTPPFLQWTSSCQQPSPIPPFPLKRKVPLLCSQTWVGLCCSLFAPDCHSYSHINPSCAGKITCSCYF